MKSKSYFKLCLVLTIVLVASLLYVPGVSNAVEGIVLGYLATTA